MLDTAIRILANDRDFVEVARVVALAPLTNRFVEMKSDCLSCAQDSCGAIIWLEPTLGDCFSAADAVFRRSTSHQASIKGVPDWAKKSQLQAAAVTDSDFSVA